MLGLVIVIGLCLCAIFAPLIAPYEQDFQHREGISLEGEPLPPSSTFLFGTDGFGQRRLLAGSLRRPGVAPRRRRRRARRGGARDLRRQRRRACRGGLLQSAVHARRRRHPVVPGASPRGSAARRHRAEPHDDADHLRDCVRREPGENRVRPGRQPARARVRPRRAGCRCPLGLDHPPAHRPAHPPERRRLHHARRRDGDHLRVGALVRRHRDPAAAGLVGQHGQRRPVSAFHLAVARGLSREAPSCWRWSGSRCSATAYAMSSTRRWNAEAGCQASAYAEGDGGSAAPSGLGSRRRQFVVERRSLPGRPRRVSFEVGTARRSGSSANPAAARASPRFRSCASCRQNGAITAGSVELREARTSSTLRNGRLDQVRGRRIAMVFQDSMTSLNPLLTIGRQITEGLEVHLGMSRRRRAAARRRAARGGRRAGARAAAPPVPASALGRAAPARRGRDRARSEPGAADRGRADHRARRDDPGAAARASAARAGRSAAWRFS